MRWYTTWASLRTALTALSVALPPRRLRLLAFYYSVLIEASVTEGVVLTTTDGTLRLTLTLEPPNAVGQAGAYVVAFAELLKAVQRFPRKASLCIEQRDASLLLALSPSDAQGHERAAIACLPASGYPALPAMRAAGDAYTVEEREVIGYGPDRRARTTRRDYEVLEALTQCLALPRALFARGLTSVAYAAAQDDSRPLLTAIYTQLQQERLTLVAADAFRLAECSLALPPGAGSWPHPLLIPADAVVKALAVLPEGPDLSLSSWLSVDLLRRVDGRDAQQAQPFLNPALLSLSTGDASLVATIRLLGGSYPPFQDLLPGAYPTRLTCAASLLVEALRALEPSAKQHSHKLELVCEEGQPLRLVIRAEGGQPMEERQVETLVSGPPVTISLNLQYVREALEAVDAQAVALDVASGTKPCVLAATQEGRVFSQHVIMPMLRER